MRSFLPFPLLVAAACGGSIDPTVGPFARGRVAPDAPAAATEALVQGDCHTTPGVVSEIFSPREYTSSSIPGGNLMVTGDHVYAALVTPGDDESSYGPMGLYAADTAPGAPWQGFLSLTDDDFYSQFLPGRDHIYWAQSTSVGAEHGPLYASIFYRGDDGAAAAVPNTQLNAYTSSTYLVHDDTAFTFFCTPGSTEDSSCVSTDGSWTLTAAHVPDGGVLFTKAIPISDVSNSSSLVADDSFLYWSARTPASKVLRIPVTGGDSEVVPVPVGAGEQVVRLVRTSNALLVVALGPRDTAITDEIVLYRLPIEGAAFGTPSRVSLGRTYLEALATAFDESSVYFTYDSATPDVEDTKRTIVRACLDGSNPTTIATGTAFGTYSVQALAVGATRAFFTSQNRVYAFDK